VEELELTPTVKVDAGDWAAMRQAVLQVVRDLVIERVPLASRGALWERAALLLEEAGFGPDELAEAYTPGPTQDLLWQALRLK